MLDKAAAGLFLELLADGEPVTFQTFDDSKVKRKEFSKVLHGGLDKHGDKLEALNGGGAGVFVMVNAGDLKGRCANNVKQVRAVFVDLDGSPLETVKDGPLKPHVLVESSPERYHAYWLTNDLPCKEFRAFQEMLAQRFDGDTVVKDLSRVMRLPGYLHRKGEPFLTHILSANDGRYSRSELMDAFGFDPAVRDWSDKSRISEGQRNHKLFSMARGFVTKGDGFDLIHKRLTAINQKRCDPPLPDAELRDVINQALKYGAEGSLSFDYRLLDSPEYRALTPMARALDMSIRRKTNGRGDAVVSLVQGDMTEWGFRNRKTLAKYRDELVASGFLVLHRPPRYGKQGETRECGLYRLATPELYGKTCHKGR
jgi:hypothetical protein